MKESQLQKQIADILRIKGIAFCKARFDRRSNITAGWPDLTFAIKDSSGRGIPIAFEVKVDKNKLSEDQILCHAEMIKNGWKVFCVRSLEQSVDLINHFTSKVYK